MTAAGLPIGGGEIPLSDIAMDVVRRGRGRPATCLRIVEELMTEAGEAAHVALTFVEALQNAASHGSPDLLTTEELLPLRGPQTFVVWETVDRFWLAVVAWCDENGVELKSSEPLRAVSNDRLRSIMWPASRSLADGRRVDLSHVLQYEKAVGVPMA
jgi:hypothetical protein